MGKRNIQTAVRNGGFARQLKAMLEAEAAALGQRAKRLRMEAPEGAKGVEELFFELMKIVHNTERI